MKIIAHRGGAGLGHENSLEAIVKSLKLGVDEIEVDVRATADNIPVLSHDDSLKRLYGHEAKIREHKYAGLLTFTTFVPTLEEAIELVNRQVPLVLDTKSIEAVGPIIALLKTYLAKGWQPNDFVFSSHHIEILTGLHAGLPDVPMTVIHPWSGIIASRRAKNLGAKRLGMNHHFLWWGYIWAMRSSAYELGVYTLDNPRKARFWQAFGLPAVITNHPERFITHDS